MEPKVLEGAALDRARELLAAGRLIAKRKAPYFRALLFSFVAREAPLLGTIGVSVNGIVLWDPWMIAQQTAEQVGGLWLHESMHRLNKHAERRGTRDPRLWNHAGDLAINEAVIEMGAELPQGIWEGLFPVKLGFPRGLSADEYYELLLKKEQQEGAGAGKKPKKGQKGDASKGTGAASADGEEEGDDASGEGGGGNDADHDHPGNGEKPKAGGGWCGSCAGRPIPGEPEENDPDGRSQGEMERLNRETAEAIREFASKGIGRLPNALRRWADEALAVPKIPWRTKLASIAKRAIAWRSGAVNHRYDAPSRRQAGLGYGIGRPILPRLRTPVPRISIVVDTSGSMGTKEIGDALGEVQGILTAVGAEVDFCACDAAVHELRPVASIREAIASLKGGGGTDFRPAFTALEARKPRPEVIIFATDGYGPAPEVPPHGIRTIWLLVGGNENPPAEWGDAVVCKD